ncbi:MAG: ribosome-binding factor A [Candidatus Jorgensenbacteria bacterium]|nr:ribosome-binding factor A [Candidatus Jorgensenbacteria bacterium]
MAELIRQEVGGLLEREFNFEGALVTILDVIVSEDLLHATVKLGIIPKERGPEVFFRVQKRTREVNYEISRKLNIRPTPHITFGIAEE